MVFVPEGQHDSSQARSAWEEMQRGPVPEGRSKAWSVPENRPAGTGLFSSSSQHFVPGYDRAVLRDKYTQPPRLASSDAS
jgi:hypothetical protein